MPSYSAPNNNVRHQRERVLGWTMQQLADFAKSKSIQLSAKTIARVEAGRNSFARVTFTRILQVVNAALLSKGLEPLSESDLFPTIKPGKGRPGKQARS